MSKSPRTIVCNQPVTSLIIKGQGLFFFENKDITKPCIFFVSSSDKKTQLKVEFTAKAVHVVNVKTNQPYLDPENKKGLVALDGAYYWFSLDAQNRRLYAGIGEGRLETVIYTYQFALNEGNKLSLETLATIEIAKESTSLAPIRLIRDPVTVAVPMLVKNTDELTMMDIAKGSYLPTANLTPMGKKLYDCVSGKNFILDDTDFPEFSKAIERSIATPGLWCNEKLKSKATEFSKDKPNPIETYLRITLGENSGESPGIPYVMEIWPIGHYSPVHSHASASAIVRVLHGSINVKLFPFLCDSATVPEFATANFKKGDITWISESLNQTHQLTNLKTNKDTCITIQCYMYDEQNTSHYDYFDFLDENGKKQQYEPDSDMDFVQFKALMKREWSAQLLAGNCGCWSF
jgi:hypothetical protein